MSQSSDAVTMMLDLLRVLYERGGEVESVPGSLLVALEDEGVGAVTEIDEDLFLTIGLGLGLMLGHAGADAEAMFAATRRDVAELGLDLEDQTFKEIALSFDDE
jgi:hypothetical protein